MQKFNPECVIFAFVKASGKPQKYSFGVAITNSRGDMQVGFSRFLGICDRVEAELRSIKLGLEQAARLKCEKIEIRVDKDYQISFLQKHRSAPGKEGVKSLYIQVQDALVQFRLHRLLQIPREQMVEAMKLAEQAQEG